MRPTPRPQEVQAYVRSARSLTDAALALYGLFGFIFLLSAAALPGFLFLGLAPLIMLIIVYFTVRVPLVQGRVREASTPALVLGIISIFFGGIPSAILLIIAFAKIGRAEEAIARVRGTGGPLLGTQMGEAGPEGPPEWIPAPSDEAPQYCPYCRAPLQAQYEYCSNCGRKIPA
ncbi:MAG: hypothetical protein ACE5I4_08835 [Thermoplasmata archaeon]